MTAKPWNMTRARANQRPRRKHKPLTVGPDAQTVALIRGADEDFRCAVCHFPAEAGCTCCGRCMERTCSCDRVYTGLDMPRSGTGIALVHKLAQDMREAPDRATSMPADTPEDKAYWLIDRIEMWLRSDHAVEYDAEHNSIMLRNEPDKGNVWAMPVEDFDGLTDEQLNRYLDKCCQSLREINRDTLPPGWERAMGGFYYTHPAGCTVRAIREPQGYAYWDRPETKMHIGATCAGHAPTRNEAMAAALALVDTLPPGWEPEPISGVADRADYRSLWHHQAMVGVWEIGGSWSYGRGEAPYEAKFEGECKTRAEAMDAALALVPVGADREGWYEEKERPGMLRYMEPRNAGVILDRYDRWCGGGAYYDTQLDAQLAVEAKYREQSR